MTNKNQTNNNIKKEVQTMQRNSTAQTNIIKKEVQTMAQPSKPTQQATNKPPAQPVEAKPTEEHSPAQPPASQSPAPAVAEEKTEQSPTLYEMVLSRALRVLNRSDFTQINGKIEITRDGTLKILSSLPISYELETLSEELTENIAKVKVKLSVEFPKAGIKRTAISSGMCEKWELQGKTSLHNMLTRAETRAIKRAVEVVLGGIINAVILKLFGTYQAGR